MTPVIAMVLFVAFLQGPVSLFEVDLWPGEGRPVFEATSRNLVLRELPSASSKISRTVSVSPRQGCRSTTHGIGRFRRGTYEFSHRHR